MTTLTLQVFDVKEKLPEVTQSSFIDIIILSSKYDKGVPMSYSWACEFREHITHWAYMPEKP